MRLPGEQVKAVHDTCSHQQYSLTEGFVEENDIECALHGSMFNLDTGEPDSLPATKPIPVYAAKVTDGVVYVDPDQQLNDPADVAETVLFALRQPEGCEIRELVVTPSVEPSWP